jgi:putative endonuclease
MYCVYIMTNKTNTVLYTGVTSDLKRRVYEHKIKAVDGFTRRYHIDKLVYFEICDEKDGAVWREKQIKNGYRQKKLDLIDGMNSKWCDLYDSL